MINVPNNDFRLKPGMTANLKVEVAKATGALRVPNAALRFRPSLDAFAALNQAVPPELPGAAVAVEADVARAAEIQRPWASPAVRPRHPLERREARPRQPPGRRRRPPPTLRLAVLRLRRATAAADLAGATGAAMAGRAAARTVARRRSTASRRCRPTSRSSTSRA